MKFLVSLIAILFIASAGARTLRVSDDRNTLQLLFNGLCEQGNLPDPKTVVSCFDDASATLTVNMVGTILDQLARNDVLGAQKTAQAYGDQLPQAVSDCLDANAEAQKILEVYHIAGLTPEQIQAKVVKYLLTHIIQLHNQIVDANNKFKSGNYVQVGKIAGDIAQKIFGNGKASLKSDRDKLQQMFNGAFETGKLADPTTVVPCFDDASATLTVNAVGDILHQAAKNNFQAAQQIATAFVNKLPQPVKDCLSTNQELIALQHAYHLDTLTPTQIQAKITAYVTTHLIQVHKDLVEADNNFQGGKFFQVGQKAGEVTQNIFGKVSSPLRSDRDKLQQMFNGAFETGKLADPTTVVPCFDDSSATLTVNAVGDILHQAAKNNFQAAQQIATAFVNKLPQPVKDCLSNNQELLALQHAYHLDTLTPTQIQAKITAYVTTHLIQVHKDLVEADNNFQGGKFFQVGQKAGEVTQNIFGKVSTQLTSDRDSLQQMFNGLFETAKLTHPTTVVPCFDDGSTTLTVTAVGAILHQAAKNNFSAAQQIATAFLAKLPQPVKDCLASNQEIEKLQQAYHLAGLTPAQIQAKVTSYATSHYFQFHKDLSTADDDFSHGKFFQVGQKGGEITQNIFGKVSFELTSDRDALQQMFNGLFETAKLPDPTTVVPCFDDGSTTLTVQAVGAILHQAAKNNFSAAQQIATAFLAKLPQPVKDCLNSNQEIEKLQQAYHLAGLTPAQIQAKVTSYATSHYFQFHSDLSAADTYFSKGQFYQVGQKGGQITQNIFGKVSAELTSDRDALQQMFNGLFETAKLPDPTTVVPCFDDGSTTLTVQAVGAILHQAAKNNFSAAQQIATAFLAKLPQPVKDCLNSNQEIEKLQQAYHLAGLTPAQIQAKVTSYATSHYFQFHSDLSAADTYFSKGQFYQVGQKGGQITQNIFGKVSLSADADTLQQFYNGLFRQAGLLEPVTIVDCFDSKSVTLTVNFIGTILQQLANNNVAGAVQSANNYNNQLPQSVKNALAANGEYRQLLLRYRIAGITLAEASNAVQKYIASHATQFNKEISAANSYFKDTQYARSGQKVGQITQTIFVGPTLQLKKVIRERNADPVRSLFDTLNGFWEQASLPHPTTPITCFNEESAQKTIEYIAQISRDLAQNNFVDISAATDKYKAQVPQSVFDCLNNDSQFQGALKAYHLDGVSVSVIQTKLAAYALLHYVEYHQITLFLYKNSHDHRYNLVGKGYGQLLQNAFAQKVGQL